MYIEKWNTCALYGCFIWSSGVSHRDPLHKDIFFADQLSVDEHTASYKMSGHSAPKVCITLMVKYW